MERIVDDDLSLEGFVKFMLIPGSVWKETGELIDFFKKNGTYTKTDSIAGYTAATWAEAGRIFAYNVITYSLFDYLV
ncbi:hypothetical protein HN681_01075 [archaeon]|nr:hypothetical protein [archaeon]MBT3730605.1 hypothetical protein [archaeon]MBT4669507.1 hypothetical protein [archaeon]MBT5030264.1 hypothetical protein [archaeon]MBT5287637.1 hypothetical protein [archaeon]